jgi:hypothetical protein
MNKLPTAPSIAAAKWADASEQRAANIIMNGLWEQDEKK